MTPGALTEAEFRAFAERLNEFVADLAPNERNFLTTALARASTSFHTDADAYPAGAQPSVCVELAYSIWHSMFTPYRSISLNPQPLPGRGQNPAVAPSRSSAETREVS